MAISGTGAYEEEIGGESRRLLLRNAEIERFEQQYDFGVFQLFDQLFGRGDAPKVSHVRDIVALALVGGGMTDRAADALIASLPPSDNLSLRLTAQRLLGVTFIPAALVDGDKKKAAGSRVKKSIEKSGTMQVSALKTSVE
ncbi:GTA-gp10 family protein [Roseobacter sp. TSBP12]|uniref:GTA-gp10 family protein n=1 Tax=Roseobacter sp. TSBP12 TaxID=1236613 RepID=UPI001869FF51|nr:GTA-gp10 family protein [Roseobacter sp. TSBP12]